MTDSQLHPQLRNLVSEAMLALTRLDADRLEELVLSCLALNSEISTARTATSFEARTGNNGIHSFAQPPDVTEAVGIISVQQSKLEHDLTMDSQSELELRQAIRELAAFGRFLDLTHENISVIERARNLGLALEYHHSDLTQSWQFAEVGNGNN